MPRPPGEAVKNATIVNTEVDYREEDDLVSAEAGTGDVSLENHKASAKAQRERLDLITQRMQLQTKLERVERTNDILSRQNTYLLSLLPKSQQGTIKAEPSDPSSSSSSETGPPPTEAQLQAELVDLKKENHALRYTFLGETSYPLDNAIPGDGVKKEETEPETKIKAELDPNPKINAEPNFGNLDTKVDLRAVLQRVKELFAENTELGRLLVGEVRGSEGGERWAEVLQESRMMITSLDDDLEQQSQEIVRLQSRISDQDKELNQLRNEVENVRKAKPRSRSRSISRGRSMSRSRSRSSSVSHSRSRSGGDRSASERSYVRSRSRTRSPARSRVRSPSPRKRARARESRSRSRSGRRDHPASDRSPGRRRPAPAKRSEIPSRSAAVPPPRSRAGTGGSNWRDAHGISISDDEDVRGSNGKPLNDPKPAGGGFSILGASSRPPPKELLPASPLRDRRNDSPDRREYGRRGGRGGNRISGGSRGGRSRSPRRDHIQDARPRQTQGRWREEDRNTRRPSVNERLDAPLQQGRRSGERGPRR